MVDPVITPVVAAAATAAGGSSHAAVLQYFGLSALTSTIGNRLFVNPRQHRYAIIQAEKAAELTLKNQKEFFAFEQKLTRETQAIAAGNNIKISISIELARRAAENSPLYDPPE